MAGTNVYARPYPHRAKGGGFGELFRSGRAPALLVLLGGLLLLYGFLLSGDYTVASVRVDGARLGDPEEIAGLADAFGKPIFELDPQGAAERVAQLPYVERVEVRVTLPDRVTIAVVEREPVATWQVGARAFLVDARGNVLREGAGAVLPGVVVEGDAPVVGGTVPAERVGAVVAVHAALGDRLDGLQWTTGDGLIARLANGRVVVFGDAERTPAKLAVLDAVLAQLPSSSNWSVLDLREPDRPYYK